MYTTPTYFNYRLQTLEVTGSNPGPAKINLIKNEKTSTGFLTLKKFTSLQGKKGRLS
jgi:hypothetical protein